MKSTYANCVQMQDCDEQIPVICFGRVVCMFKIILADFMSDENGSLVLGVVWESKTRSKEAVAPTIRRTDFDKCNDEADEDDGQHQREFKGK